MKLMIPAIYSIALALVLLTSYFICFENAPTSQKSIKTEDFGEIAISKPMWNAKGLALVFVDAKKYTPTNLANNLASIGIAAAVIDTNIFFTGFSAEKNLCINPQKVASLINKLIKDLPFASQDRLFVTGIAEGALVPYLNALSDEVDNAENLSVGFSVNLPNDLNLCPPLSTEIKDQKHLLVSAPDLKTHWRTAWNDKPRGDNGIFMKEKVPHADTNIAAYNTPLDTLLSNELSLKLGQDSNHPPMPTIEIPAPEKGDVVTLFYSGDGGWRDLDKTVAEEMLKMNHSVIGVDVLRYFWERKTPEQVTADLSATMAYYRTNWGSKRFVLVGFSFGADILPVLYNRLSTSDQEAVDLLVFLALGKHADFEVHVAGWLGQSTHEMPLDIELAKMPKHKLLCIYGTEEKAKSGTACSSLENSEATVLGLPGGHHFDNDYPKLTKLILANYRQHGIN